MAVDTVEWIPAIAGQKGAAMRSNETRFLFTARRITVTDVSGYVEATDSEDARRKLSDNVGVIEVEQVGQIVTQGFDSIRIGGPAGDEE